MRDAPVRLTLGRLAASGADKPRLLAKLARRAARIFLIGFLRNLVPHLNFGTVRIPGVLQRIALCTLLAAPVVAYLGSTIAARCSQLFGVLAGRVLALKLPRIEQAMWMLFAGLVFLALGSSLDAVLMPINESQWTVSYCLWMTGWALPAFGTCYWLLDANPHAIVRERAAAWARPVVIYGMNALFIFALSGLIARMLGFIELAQPDGSQLPLGRTLYASIKALPMGAANTSLLYAILFNASMCAIAYGMWRKRWFVKV